MAESFGPYLIGELLGRGGMGEVHRAHDTTHDRVVALKRLSPALDDEEYRARFRREARIVARLREPHVVPIHAYGEIDGRLYLDMRLVEGTDLGVLVAAGPLDPARAVRIVVQVAGALDAAHADGVVHRDVKPSNVLVTPEDFAYLADFGIARDILPNGTSATASGAVVGTVDYMAPERFDGVVDGRADVYALACVLFAAITGRRPFEVDGLAAQIWAHMRQPPPAASRLNPAVPPALDEVIRRGMAKDPAHRHPTAGEFAADASAALERPFPQALPRTVPAQRVAPRPIAPGPVTSGPIPVTPRPFTSPPVTLARQAVPPRRRPVAPLVAGGVALVLVMALVVWAAMDWSTDGRAGGTTTATTTATTTTEKTTTAPPTTTTTTQAVSTADRTLLERLPATYRGNPSCVPTAPEYTGVTATVVCTKANSEHGRFPAPQRAVFYLFTDGTAQQAHFQGIVQENNIPRDDQWGGCRPQTQPAHYALYYRGEGTGATPGEFVTCFVKDGVGQLWWVDTRTSTTGSLLSTAATGAEELDDLGYWWNTMILS